MTGSWLLHKGFRRTLLALVAVQVALSLPLGIKASTTATNRVEDWLPEDAPEVKDLHWFVKLFGSGDIVVMSWPGCTIEDLRATQLAAALMGPAISGDETIAPLFSSVITGREVMMRLGRASVGLSREEVARRMTGWALGPDGLQTAVIGVVSQKGIERRGAVIAWVKTCVEGIPGLDWSQVRLGGTAVASPAIDDLARRHLPLLGGLSMLLCLMIACVSLRSLRWGATVVVVGYFARVVALAVVPLTGGHTDTVVLLMGSLVFVLTVAGGVHVLGYAREGDDGVGINRAVAALQRAWRPCLLATGTTAFGTLALVACRIVPVVRFGIYSAIGLALSLIFVLGVVPALIAESGTAFAPRRLVVKRWRRFADGVERRHTLILSVLVMVFVLAVVGAARLQTTGLPADLVSDESRFRQDERWLERSIGPLIPLEVVVELPRDRDGDVLPRLELLERVHERVAGLPGTGAVISALTFLPPLDRIRLIVNDATLWNPTSRRSVEHRLQQGGWLRVDDGENGAELWRLTCRLPTEGVDDLGRRLLQIKAAVEEEIAGSPGARTRVVGGAAVVDLVQRQVLADLLIGVLGALALVTLVMVAAVRSWRVGLLAMVPNLFPVVVAFGWLGWTGVRVEIGSVLTGSVALGVAVDDTIHLLESVRRHGDRGRQAVALALAEVGPAVVKTSLICGGGLALLGLSPFVPTARFGLLLAAMLGLALVGDLILLPAMLLLPPGRAFLERAHSRCNM